MRRAVVLEFDDGDSNCIASGRICAPALRCCEPQTWRLRPVSRLGEDAAADSSAGICNGPDPEVLRAASDVPNLRRAAPTS